MKETKGQANDWSKPQFVINEVESDCEDIVTDWVEIYNAGSSMLIFLDGIYMTMIQ